MASSRRARGKRPSRPSGTPLARRRAGSPAVLPRGALAMVGKPNFPEDVDKRGDLKGSAVGTPGLTALDEEREASLADEAGASGAHVPSPHLATQRNAA